MSGCDQFWLDAHAALPELHARKSATYGTETDRFANFTSVAAVTGDAPERYALQRLLEKVSRSLHMVDAGIADDVREYPDIASLALVCAALQRRRTATRGLLPLDEPLAA